MANVRGHALRSGVAISWLIRNASVMLRGANVQFSNWVIQKGYVVRVVIR